MTRNAYSNMKLLLDHHAAALQQAAGSPFELWLPDSGEQFGYNWAGRSASQPDDLLLRSRQAKHLLYMSSINLLLYVHMHDNSESQSMELHRAVLLSTDSANILGSRCQHA